MNAETDEMQPFSPGAGSRSLPGNGFRAALLLLLVSMLQVLAQAAGFQISAYSDLSATVNGSGGGATAADGTYGGRSLTVTYTVNGPMVGTYQVAYKLHLKVNTLDKAYTPFPIFFTSVPATWQYDNNYQTFRFYKSDGSLISTWSDPCVSGISENYFERFKAASNSHLPKGDIRLWGSPNDAMSSNADFIEYSPADFLFTPNFTETISAYPFYPAGFGGNPDAPDDPSTGVPRAFAKITYKDDPKYFGTVFWFPGKGDKNPFNKPLVVGDAFDPYNKRDAKEIYESPQYSNLLKMPGSSPRNSGYDLFFVDFSQGGGDIHINAMIELKLVEWLRSMNAAKVVIGGPSMSGIVARLACLYSIPENNSTGTDLGTNIKGYMSIDSPQKGASISGNFQRCVYNVQNDDFIQFEAWAAGAADPADKWKMLNVPAAHQMLFEHYYAGGNVRGVTDSHDAFYGFLAQLGNYRKGMPKVAIAYSNFYKPYPGFTAQPNVLYTTGHITPPQATQRDFGAQNWELSAGSTGFWYRSSYNGVGADYVSLNAMGVPPDATPEQIYLPPIKWETFQGTFIPIESALDLTGYPAPSSPTPNPDDVARYSPFDKIFFMNNTYNGYCGPSGTCTLKDQCGTPGGCKQDINQKRYEHLVFDEQLMAAINSGLAEIEKSVKRKTATLASTMSLLLD